MTTDIFRPPACGRLTAADMATGPATRPPLRYGEHPVIARYFDADLRTVALTGDTTRLKGQGMIPDQLALFPQDLTRRTVTQVCILAAIAARIVQED